MTTEVRSCPLIHCCQNHLLRLYHLSQSHNILLPLIQRRHVLLPHLHLPDSHCYQVITPLLSGELCHVHRDRLEPLQVSEHRGASMKTIIKR